MAPPRHPVRLLLHTSGLVRAGLTAMLDPHSARVTVLPPATCERAEVAVVDPLHRARPSLDAERPWLPVLALVHEGDRLTRALAHELGAHRILSHSPCVEEVLSAVEALRDAPPSVGRPDDDRLSPRESEVVSRICLGMSNAEIAQAMYLSVNSIKTHVRCAYRKMGVTRRSQAVLWGVERGLVDRSDW